MTVTRAVVHYLLPRALRAAQSRVSAVSLPAPGFDSDSWSRGAGARQSVRG